MSATPAPDGRSRVERDEAYLRDLAAEEAYWDRLEDPLDVSPFPDVARYVNERLTGDKDRRWFETLADHGASRRGCVLGAGPGDAEAHLLAANPGLRLTVLDIAGDALTRLEARVGREHAGRLETRREDFNFMELPADSYDLIVADSCIHHVVNIEHLAHQINRALTPEGRFFLHDTVCESSFQFADEKKRLFQLFQRATQGNPYPAPRMDWPDRDRWRYSPFEAVRSGEILEVFRARLQEVSLRTSSALVQLLLFCGRPQVGRLGPLARAYHALRWRLGLWDLERGAATAELLFALDAVCCDTGYLRPGLAFAVYRKRSSNIQT